MKTLAGDSTSPWTELQPEMNGYHGLPTPHSEVTMSLLCCSCHQSGTTSSREKCQVSTNEGHFTKHLARTLSLSRSMKGRRTEELFPVEGDKRHDH